MKTRSLRNVCSAAIWMTIAAAAQAQITERVSIATGGAQGNGHSLNCSMSADGRFVAFQALASNFAAGDTNGAYDIFVRDRQGGTTECVSVNAGGVQGDANSLYPSISADGRFVAFHSLASNLVAGDTNGSSDVFVHDRQAGTIERVSVDSNGVEGNSNSFYPSVSADGRFIAFHSLASNLIPSDTNGAADVFVHDRVSGTTDRVSVGILGAQGDDLSSFPSISADGRFVAFHSLASNLVAVDTNGAYDVFVHDRVNGTTERVSVDSNGVQGDFDSHYASISGDGRFVAFDSQASDLVAGDSNGTSDIFLRDRLSGTTERLSVDSAGMQAHSSCEHPAITADGRFVAFAATDSTLVSGDTNGVQDVFVRDRPSGTTERVSVSSGGVQGNANSLHASISADGRWTAFHGLASNLVAGDSNAANDVFVHDRNATGFTSLCDAGVGGVIACPCANPPSGASRGCDNSAGTGGAVLSASGISYLAIDSLVFTTSSEKPTATSVVLQGTAHAASGAVYGQGVRCAGGALKRLYTKNAVGGSITAPDFGAGDPTVSARSAAKGDVIQAGQSRWYLVYYRDPIVLGGCPASSTFNATQTGRVDWSM